MVSSPLLAAPKLNQVTLEDGPAQPESAEPTITFAFKGATFEQVVDCLLYTSDAADES